MCMMLIVGFVVVVGVVQVKQDLKDVLFVWNGLLNIGIVNEICEICFLIFVCMVWVVLCLNFIQNEVEGMGYSQVEIDVFCKSEVNKVVMWVEGEVYMKNNGVVKGDVEIYCVFGCVEIVKFS